MNVASLHKYRQHISTNIRSDEGCNRTYFKKLLSLLNAALFKLTC